jgi:hypothetical protein
MKFRKNNEQGTSLPAGRQGITNIEDASPASRFGHAKRKP